MSLPKSLLRLCYRCHNHIMWADTPVRVLVRGVSVNMHQSCEALWKKEMEGLTDEEIEGTEALKEAQAPKTA